MKSFLVAKSYKNLAEDIKSFDKSGPVILGTGLKVMLVTFDIFKMDVLVQAV